MEVPHCLSRGFLHGENLTEYAQRMRPTALEKLLGASSYEEFNHALENGPHLSIPFSIHGDFSTPTAPQGMRPDLTVKGRADFELYRSGFLPPSYAVGQAVVEVAAG